MRPITNTNFRQIFVKSPSRKKKYKFKLTIVLLSSMATIIMTTQMIEQNRVVIAQFLSLTLKLTRFYRKQFTVINTQINSGVLKIIQIFIKFTIF